MTTGATGRTPECDVYTLQPVWSCQTLRTGGLCVCQCLSVPKWLSKGEPSLPSLSDGSETSFSGNFNYILSQPLMAVNLRPGRLSKPSPQSNNDFFFDCPHDFTQCPCALWWLPFTPVEAVSRMLDSAFTSHVSNYVVHKLDYMVSLALMVVHLWPEGRGRLACSRHSPACSCRQPAGHVPNTYCSRVFNTLDSVPLLEVACKVAACCLHQSCIQQIGSVNTHILMRCLHPVQMHLSAYSIRMPGRQKLHGLARLKGDGLAAIHGLTRQLRLEQQLYDYQITN